MLLLYECHIYVQYIGGGGLRQGSQEVLGQTAELQFYLLRSFCALGMAMPFAILDIAPKTQAKEVLAGGVGWSS